VALLLGKEEEGEEVRETETDRERESEGRRE